MVGRRSVTRGSPPWNAKHCNCKGGVWFQCGNKASRKKCFNLMLNTALGTCIYILYKKIWNSSFYYIASHRWAGLTAETQRGGQVIAPSQTLSKTVSSLCWNSIPPKNETVWASALFHRATFLQRRSSELMDNEELQVSVLKNKDDLWNKMALLNFYLF